MSIQSVLQLIRFGNCLLAALSVWVGAYMTVGLGMSPELSIAMAGVFFICAGGNLINDIRDRETDRVSHPDRPLPSGNVTEHQVWWLAGVVHALAILLILFSNRLVGLIGLTAIILLLAYNFGLKRIPLLGNLIVASLAGMTFVCGGLAVDPVAALTLPGPLIATVFAFLFHLIREIVKDVEDREGDRRVGSSSLAMWLGVRPSLGISLGLYLILAALTFVPYAMEWYGLLYLLIVLVGLNIPLTAVLLLSLMKPTVTHLAWARQSLKIGMLIGLASLLIG